MTTKQDKLAETLEQEVGSIAEAKVIVPHEEKGSIEKYNRHHSGKHREKDHIGGKFKRGERSERSHAYHKPEKDEGIRVEKKIAELLDITKEEANKLIKEGKVKVNNIVVNDLSLHVTYEDTIHVHNRSVVNRRIPLKVYIFNKPKGYIVTNNDPAGRDTIFDIIPKKLGRLMTVGRLDLNSEGLMLLTNNGDFARMMEMPSSGIKREYRVRVFGDVDMKKMYDLEKGITIDDINYGSIIVTAEQSENADSANKWLRVILSEGKNREIRKVMEHFGLQVNRLIRVSYGKYKLNNLLSGCVSEVKPFSLNIGHKHDKYKKDNHGKKRFNNRDRKKSSDKK